MDTQGKEGDSLNSRIHWVGRSGGAAIDVRPSARSRWHVLIGSLIALPAFMTVALAGGSTSAAAAIVSDRSSGSLSPTTLPPLPGPLSGLLPAPIASANGPADSSGSPPPPPPPPGSGSGGPASAPRALAGAPVQRRARATVAGTSHTTQLTAPTDARLTSADAAAAAGLPSGLTGTGSWRILPPSGNSGATAAALPPVPSFLSHLPLAGWALFAAVDLLLVCLLLQRRWSWMQQWARAYVRAAPPREGKDGT
jgi:hypothetical protein